ncbi:hypothetical protein HAX54_006916, partial [Datura stramonium]|nr:hypothetical protein [Datura stramonium]
PSLPRRRRCLPTHHSHQSAVTTTGDSHHYQSAVTTTIRQSPLNSQQPSLVSHVSSPSTIHRRRHPIFPTPHRSAIALASKQRVVTRQSSLSLISARLSTLHLCRLLQSSTAPRLHLQDPVSSSLFRSSSTPPFDSNLKSSK